MFYRVTRSRRKLDSWPNSISPGSSAIEGSCRVSRNLKSTSLNSYYINVTPYCTRVQPYITRRNARHGDTYARANSFSAQTTPESACKKQLYLTPPTPPPRTPQPACKKPLYLTQLPSPPLHLVVVVEYGSACGGQDVEPCVSKFEICSHSLKTPSRAVLELTVLARAFNLRTQTPISWQTESGFRHRKQRTVAVYIAGLHGPRPCLNRSRVRRKAVEHSF